ncbi:general substrate transporter [Apiospora phragmitis]|uniref:General substrate transporter n=1 Tax=Apiospora phragmitis TaxID=2905665 RepID=A0ABR1T9I5_9PEZI
MRALAIGGFLFGYDSGIITSTIALDTFRAYFSAPSETVTGGIVSAFQGGAILGTIFNMLFANALGRRKTIFIGALVSVLGSSLQAGAVNMTMLIVGRFIGGVAVGQLTSTIPMYASELSEAKHRGMLSGLLQLMLSWGFFVAQWVGYGCSFISTQFSWRFPLAFQNIPGLILISGIFFLQESPRWLIEKDRADDARRSLQRLRRGLDEHVIELEFREIRDVILADRELLGHVTWKSIVTKPTWRRRLLLGCGVQAFGPLSGINVINYYGPSIYKILGLSTQQSLLIIGISGALSIVYCSVGLLLLDRVGRVRPLLVSAAGLAAALLVNAPLLHALGIISWVYPAEIFPVEARALGNAITTFTNWAVNLIFAQFSPAALAAIGFRYFYVFFALNIVAFLCYWFFYPETKGRTLEQMDELFGDQLVPHALQDETAAAIALEKHGLGEAELREHA